MKKYADYYSLLRFLKKKLDLNKKVVVRRVRTPNDSLGDCTKRRQKFFIRIDRDLPQVSAIETLIHEMGHCLAWHDDNHGRDWGAAYSKVFRTYLMWIEAENAKDQAA